MHSDATHEPMGLGGFSFDPGRLELRDAAGRLVALRPQALSVLGCLAAEAGYVVERDRLMREVWQDVVVTDGSLAQCINEIRRALDDAGHRIVETAPKRGLSPGRGGCAVRGAFGLRRVRAVHRLRDQR